MARKNPYGRFRGQKLTLNDSLAIDRTVLANERTLLAYGRTALALAIVGGTCLNVFESPWIRGTGVAIMLAGALVAVRGWRRYVFTRQLLAAALEHETGTPEHPLQEEVKPPPEKASKEE